VTVKNVLSPARYSAISRRAWSSSLPARPAVCGVTRDVGLGQYLIREMPTATPSGRAGQPRRSASLPSGEDPSVHDSPRPICRDHVGGRLRTATPRARADCPSGNASESSHPAEELCADRDASRIAERTQGTESANSRQQALCHREIQVPRSPCHPSPIALRRGTEARRIMRDHSQSVGRS